MYTDIRPITKPTVIAFFPNAGLKEVQILPPGCAEPEIAYYAIFDDVCVFSGINNLYGGTSGWAEEYIQNIAKQEKRKVSQFIFYDLQTFAGELQRGRGQFSFYRLEFKYDEGELTVYDWVREFCPPEIRAIFADCIGVPEYMLH